MTGHTPTTQMVKRVYVLAPDDLARDGRKEWSMVADDQFDRWYKAARDDARAAALRDAPAPYPVEVWQISDYGENRIAGFIDRFDAERFITAQTGAWSRNGMRFERRSPVVDSTPEGQTP